MKRNKNKIAAFAETKKEFVRYMMTYVEMQLGWKSPTAGQTPLWWGAQYDIIDAKQEIPLVKQIPILRIEKLGDQWYDTQEWTAEFHGTMAKVIPRA